MTDAHQKKRVFGTTQSELQICSHTKTKVRKELGVGVEGWKCKRDEIGRDFHLYTEEADNSFIEYRLCE